MKLLTPFLPYVAGVLLLALLSVGIAWRVEVSRLATRTTERDAARTEVTRLQAAINGKDATIAAQSKAIDLWQAQATPTKAMEDAAARTEAAAKLIEDRARSLSAAEVKDRANPDCAALLAMDIARLCPATADSVRTRARGGVPR
jgi:hypothetical protein